MRASERLVVPFIALSAIFLFAGPVAAQVDIEKVEGIAEVYFPRTQTWREVHETPYRVERADRIRSGASSSVTIKFPDGSHILLGPSSEFVVDSGTKDEVLLSLNIGSVKAWVAKFTSRKAFHIKTPTAVCAVRGTQFIVDVSPAQVTGVDVSEGVVAVKTLLGEELELGDGRPMRSIRIIPDRPLDLPATPASAAPVKAAKAVAAAPASAARLLVATRPATVAPPVAARSTIVGTTDATAEFKKDVQREVALGMAKEAVQAAAAEEARRAEYQEGKTLVDVNGVRVRLDEYVVRPAADTFKLVALNSRADRFDYFYYQAQFNQTLPTDLRQALQYLNGKDGSAPPYFITAYETGRSNTRDSVQEFGSGGHLVNNPLTADQTIYDASQNAFRTITAGTAFWSTLFDNYSYRINGAEKFGWSPAAGTGITSYDYVAGGIQTRIWGGAGNPMTVCTTSACESAARPAVTSQPDGSGFLHDRATITYAADGSQETYDFFIINDAGRLAKPSDFGGVTDGESYLNTLLKYNFQQTIKATEFQGRTIDFVVEPKILIKAGVIQ